MSVFIGLFIIIFISVFIVSFRKKRNVEGMTDGTRNSIKAAIQNASIPANTSTDVPEDLNDDDSNLNTYSVDDTSLINKLNEKLQKSNFTNITGVKASDYSVEQTYNYDHYTKTENSIVFFGPNNSTATVSLINNRLQINVNYGDGSSEIFIFSSTTDGQIVFVGISNSQNSAVLTKTENKSQVVTVYANGTTYTFYSNIHENTNDLSSFIDAYYYSGDAGVDEAGKLYGVLTSLVKNQTAANYPYMSPIINTNPTTQFTSNYNDYLPPGIPRSQIPTGMEDLYILKTEIVPPVCPVCPSPIIMSNCAANGKGNSKSNTSDYPPCPACKRCPEPVVDCKKVIKYKNNSGTTSYDSSNDSSNDSSYNSSYKSNGSKNGYSNPVQSKLIAGSQNVFNSEPELYDQGTQENGGPMPVLNSFSSFGL